MAPVDVNTTSIILSSNKIQNGGSLVAANTGPPGKMAVKQVILFLLLSGVNKEDTDGVLDGLI